jgi:hypothetical protein
MRFIMDWLGLGQRVCEVAQQQHEKIQNLMASIEDIGTYSENALRVRAMRG